MFYSSRTLPSEHSFTVLREKVLEIYVPKHLILTIANRLEQKWMVPIQRDIKYGIPNESTILSKLSTATRPHSWLRVDW